MEMKACWQVTNDRRDIGTERTQMVKNLISRKAVCKGVKDKIRRMEIGSM